MKPNAASAPYIPSSFDVKDKTIGNEKIQSNLPADLGEDEEYEEAFLFLDFPDFDGIDFLDAEKQLIFDNLAGPNPSCRIGNLSFSGRHELNLGTQIFLPTKRQDTGSVSQQASAFGDAKKGSDTITNTTSIVKFELKHIDVESVCGDER